MENTPNYNPAKGNPNDENANLLSSLHLPNY